MKHQGFVILVWDGAKPFAPMSAIWTDKRLAEEWAEATYPGMRWSIGDVRGEPPR